MVIVLFRFKENMKYRLLAALAHFARVKSEYRNGSVSPSKLAEFRRDGIIVLLGKLETHVDRPSSLYNDRTYFDILSKLINFCNKSLLFSFSECVEDIERILGWMMNTINNDER